MPDACRNEATVWLKVQIENRRMSILAAGMRKVNADVSFERTPVRREAGVAIDAKQGAAGRPRIGDEVGTDPAQVGRKSADERQRWFDNGRWYRALFFANHSRSLCRFSCRRNTNISGLKNAVPAIKIPPVQTSVYRLRSACLYLSPDQHCKLHGIVNGCLQLWAWLDGALPAAEWLQ